MKKSSLIRRLFSFGVAALLVAALLTASPVVPAYAAGITVNTSSDTVAVDGFCSLREAIANANNDAATNVDCTAGSGTDTITFGSDYTITLSAGTLSLSSPMTIEGGEGRVIIIDANNSSRVFSTSSTVTLDNLTMTNGNGAGGVGGGILVTSGTLTIQNSTVSNNNAPSDAGGIYIANSATLFVKNSTINGNYAAGQGGAIMNSSGYLNVFNSTIYDNTSNSNGGGIADYGFGTTIINSTIVNNTATSAPGGIYHGGGLSLGLNNSIIASNSPSNCGGNPNTGSNNLDNDGTCNATNSLTINLGTFGDYGGLTNTVPLLAGSSALDAGANGICAAVNTINNLDQRSVSRPQNVTCDIGAFELVQCPIGFYDNGSGACAAAPVGTFIAQANASSATPCPPGSYQNQTGQASCILADPGFFVPAYQSVAQTPCPSGTTSLAGAVACTIQSGPNFQVNVDTDTDDGACGIAPEDCTLREAINAANALSGTDNITFYDNYTITLDGSQLPAVTSQIIIYGNGANHTIIQAAATPNTATWRVFEVNSGGNLTLDGVTVQNGRCNGACSTYSNAGGGIMNEFSTLTVTNSVISGNSGGYFGGGIYNHAGTLNVTRSTFSANSAEYGGGIYNDTTNATCSDPVAATISNSTFSGNSASADSGGIHNNNGLVMLLFNTITDNTGGGLFSFNDDFTCTLAGNNIIHGNIGDDVSAYITTQRFSSLGHNLIGVAGANVDFAQEFNATGDLTGPSYGPNLGPLQDNGGSTFTHALLPGSDALEAGDNVACAASPINSFDQRGVARPQNPSCDIGAFEAVPMPDLTVTKYNLSGGTRLYPNGWRWVINVTNNGTADATFTNGQTILIDNLPTNASYSWAASDMNSITGNEPISSFVGTDLTWKADGTLVIHPGGNVAIGYDVLPSAPGIYANPRAGGICKVDPNSINAESDESNNNCSDTVISTEPVVDLSATSLNFGFLPVGVVSAPQTVTITNTGNGSLNLGTLGINSDFGLSNDTCSGASVAPSGTCTFDVLFQPLSLGAKAGSVTIPSNAATTPDSVSLSGSGIAPLSTTFTSLGAYDGNIFETTEFSGLGGTPNISGGFLDIGDMVMDRQILSFLHFDTSSLPDGAQILSLTLQLKRYQFVGTDPFTLLGNLNVDIASPYFGAEMALRAGDFQASPSQDNVGIFNPTPLTGNWYESNLGASAFPYLNLTGATQFRLHFTLDDNDDLQNDFIRFFSGNAPIAGYRPVLIVEYYVP